MPRVDARARWRASSSSSRREHRARRAADRVHRVQLLDLGEREAERLQARDEAQPLELVRAVDAPAARAPAHARQQARAPRSSGACAPRQAPAVRRGRAGRERARAASAARAQAGEAQRISLAATLARITIHPARVLGVDAGRLAVGAPADVVLFDPRAPFHVSAQSLRSQGKNTPFLGHELAGRVRYTIVAGNVAYEG